MAPLSTRNTCFLKSPAWNRNSLAPSVRRAQFSNSTPGELASVFEKNGSTLGRTVPLCKPERPPVATLSTDPQAITLLPTQTPRRNLDADHAPICSVRNENDLSPEWGTASSI